MSDKYPNLVQAVTTDQLRTGDVVLRHGMRLRLNMVATYTGTNGEVRWSCTGTIENLDEVHADGFIRCATSGMWAAQGSTLANWARIEKESSDE